MGDPILEAFVATEYISGYSFKADAINISTRFLVIAKVLEEQTKTPAQIGRSIVIKVRKDDFYLRDFRDEFFVFFWLLAKKGRLLP